MLTPSHSSPLSNPSRFSLVLLYSCRTLPVVMIQMMTPRAGVKGKSREAVCVSKHGHSLTLHLANIYTGVVCVCVGLDLTRDRVQEVARRTLQRRRKGTVTSQCLTMSPVTKSRAENLQTSTVFTLILVYFCCFM